MNDDTVSLYIEFSDIEFVKKAILQRAEYLVDYIDGRESEKRIDIEEKEEEEREQLDLLRSQNERLQEHLRKSEAKINPFALTPERIRVLKEAGFWTKKQDEEIKDVEMDEFQADIKEMLEKHQPKRRLGRPVGSKNKVKANAK
jgi:multidrug resistance efflux pump